MLAASHWWIETTHCEGAGRNNETLSPLYTLEGFVSVQYMLVEVEKEEGDDGIQETAKDADTLIVGITLKKKTDRFTTRIRYTNRPQVSIHHCCAEPVDTDKYILFNMS